MAFQNIIGKSIDRIDDTIEVVVEAVELNIEKNRMNFKAWGINQNDIRVLEAEGVIMPPKKPKARIGD